MAGVPATASEVREGVNFTYNRKAGRWYVNGKPMPYGIRPSQHLRSLEASNRALFMVFGRYGKPLKPADIRRAIILNS